MKTLPLVVGLLSLLTVNLTAQTTEERAKASAYLKKTETGVLDAVKGLSEAQLKFKPAPDRWSVSEVLEHIAAAEDMFMGLIKGQVMSAPARPPGDDVAAIDALILKAIPDRSQKAQAPEPLVPKNRFGSPAEALKHFETSRAQTLAFLDKSNDLRDHAIDSPLGKKLDAYEWILFAAAHSDRHTKQMLEVKADPHFPKS